MTQKWNESMKAIPPLSIRKTKNYAAPILFASMAFFACQKKETAGKVGISDLKPLSSKAASASGNTSDQVFPPDHGNARFFDSIGPGLTDDLNGDGLDDTTFAVHVRSANQIKSAPFSMVTIDTTSPYEDLCGGWGVFMSLSKKDSLGARWESFYFCGQQSRVQEFSWVGTERLDTLPYPEMKSNIGKGVNHVISLFTQAGIQVYLFYNGRQFEIYEPEEEP